ncbi:MAG TPA: hypothetical protein VJP77_05670 [Planctomycetota bacterium]|nr:hypothetical protein [Planctomycetota bacterium]
MSDDARVLSVLAGLEPSVVQVAEYARQTLGIPVPESTFADADSPADLLRELWCGSSNVVCVAGRDSFKTLTISAAEFLLAHFRGVRVIHYAARDYQAQRAWEYMTGWTGMPHWQPHARATLSAVRFASGGSIEFLPVTPGSVRSPHVELSVFDEADEMDLRLRGIAVGVLSSSDAAPGRQVDISTRNRRDGVIASRIASAARSRIRVIQWPYKVAAERCPDERSGTAPATWTDPEGVAHPVLEGCPACPLVGSCLGDLKRSEGSRPIADLIAKYVDPSMTNRLWRSEYENVEPSVEGLVIPEFDMARSVTEMAEYDPGLPWSMGVDFGANNLGVIVAGQAIPYKRAMRDGTVNMDRHRKTAFAIHAAPLSFSPHMEEYVSRQWVPRYGLPSAVYVDPSGFPALGEARFEKDGRPRRIATTKAKTSHLHGFNALRGHLAPRAGEKFTTLLLHPRLEALVAELRSLSYVQKAPEEWSEQVARTDRTDALRYLVMGLSDTVPMGAEEVAAGFQRLQRMGLGG